MPQGPTWHNCRRPSGVQTHSASSLRLMASPVSCRMLGPGDSICLTAAVACSASHVNDCVILLQQADCRSQDMTQTQLLYTDPAVKGM